MPPPLVDASVRGRSRRYSSSGTLGRRAHPCAPTVGEVRFRGAPSPFGPSRATVVQPGDLRAGGAMPAYASRGVHAEGTAPFAAHGAPPHKFATADGKHGRVGGNVLFKIACSTDGQSHSLKRHTDLRAKSLSSSNIKGKQHDRSVARSNRSARTSFSYHTYAAVV